MSRLPLFIRRFVLIFAGSALASLAALSLSGDAVADAHAAAVALASAAMGAASMEIPDFLAWLRGQLGLEADAA